MPDSFSMYKYFKGEKENPFDNVTQNAAHMFWFYEQLFEDKFSKGDFSEDAWIIPDHDNPNEWKEVLSSKSVNKEDLFKLWLFHLLMVRLPDRYLSEHDEFLHLYYDTNVKPIAAIKRA